MRAYLVECPEGEFRAVICLGPFQTPARSWCG
jgi:hypothetical protein